MEIHVSTWSLTGRFVRGRPIHSSAAADIQAIIRGDFLQVFQSNPLGG